MASQYNNGSQRAPWAWINPNPDWFEAPDQRFWGHRDILTRSLARYRFVAPHAHGIVLDIGCGRGYGFDILAPCAERLFGMDISNDFLHQAQQSYPHSLLLCANGTNIPFQTASFHMIIAFEVIEHLDDDKRFLDDVCRLIHRDGVIALSTPNRRVSSGGKETTKPLNRFHTREYIAEEFLKLLQGTFSDVELYGQYEQYEQAGEKGMITQLINRIPMHIKYLLPAYVQDVISVTLRPPLETTACHFRTDHLDDVHTFVAICRP